MATSRRTPRSGPGISRAGGTAKAGAAGQAGGPGSGASAGSAGPPAAAAPPGRIRPVPLVAPAAPGAAAAPRGPAHGRRGRAGRQPAGRRPHRARPGRQIPPMPRTRAPQPARRPRSRPCRPTGTCLARIAGSVVRWPLKHPMASGKQFRSARLGRVAPGPRPRPCVRCAHPEPSAAPLRGALTRIWAPGRASGPADRTHHLPLASR